MMYIKLSALLPPFRVYLFPLCYQSTQILLIIMTSRIFPSCQQQNHEILRDDETCQAYGSPPWGPLPSFSASNSVIRRPQQPQVMQAPTATHPPAFGLASHLIGSGGGGGRRGTSQQRARARPSTLSTTTSSTPHSALSSALSSALPFCSVLCFCCRAENRF